MYNFTLSPRNPRTLQLLLHPKAVHSVFLLCLTIWFVHVHYFCQFRAKNSSEKNQSSSPTSGTREALELQPKPAWGQVEATRVGGLGVLPEGSDKEKDHFLGCERVQCTEPGPVFPLALWGGGGCLEETSGCVSDQLTRATQALPFLLLPLGQGQGQVQSPRSATYITSMTHFSYLSS